MDRKRVELIITGILIIGFVLLLTNSFKKVKAKSLPPKPMPAAENTSIPKAISIVDAKREEEKRVMVEDESSWARDPFALHAIPQSTGDSIASLKVNGITTGKSGKAMAIINDEIVSVGSRIGKFTVVRIAEKIVTVTDGKNNFELEMK